MVHYTSGATKSKLHNSKHILQSYSGYESPTYQEPFNNSSPYGRDLAAQTTVYLRGFIKGRAPGKLTGCEHDFARLLYISKNFFLIQGTIKNSFKLQSCPFLDESYRV